MHPDLPEKIMYALSVSNTTQILAGRTVCFEILKSDPENPICLELMGKIEYQLGNFDQSELWFEKAFVAKPDSTELYFNYAQNMTMQKKYPQAIAAFTQILKLNPGHMETLYRLGSLLEKSGDDATAAKAYHRALAINPKLSAILNNLGCIKIRKKDLAGAVHYLNRALAIRADDPLPHNNLGVAYAAQGNLQLAMHCYQNALALKPDYPDALNNLGKIYRQQGAFTKSVTLYKKALALLPDFPEAMNNLGVALKACGKLDEAIEAYQNALALNGNCPDWHSNLAMALLAAGRFVEGWPEYEWRWKSNQLPALQPGYEKLRWQGIHSTGKTLLIRAEQGLGDTLQFCRYVPLVQSCGLRVILEVPGPLVRLLASLGDVVQIIAQGTPPPPFDYYCPMLSLPLAFQTRLDTIPANVPYLFAATECIEKWRCRMPNNSDNKLKVGLVWAGSSRPQSPELVTTDRRRSMEPDLLAPLLDLPGIQFFCLQKFGPMAPEKFGLVDFMEECVDFAETAALIANLDLVVSVDTAVAHLAGALGKPIWLLNRFDTCWRWLLKREDSPWYPSMRIFRQSQPGDWHGVIACVKNELQKYSRQLATTPCPDKACVLR